MIASDSSVQDSLAQEGHKIEQHIKTVTALLPEQAMTQEQFDSFWAKLSTPEKSQLTYTVVQTKKSPPVGLLGLSDYDAGGLTQEDIFHYSDPEFWGFRLSPAESIAESAMRETEETKTSPLTCLAIIRQVNRMAQLQADQPENRLAGKKSGTRGRASDKKQLCNKKQK